MAICSIAGRASAVCTTVRGPAVYATTGVKPRIKEVGISNTTTTDFVVGIARATATGTKGAALTAVCEDDDSHAAVATGSNTHTADATVGAAIRQATIAGAKGAGWIFPFDDLVLDKATTSGIVIICPTGTGQIFDFWIKWEE